MKKTKVLFINTEVFPYLDESRMAHHGRYLPQYLQECGHEVRVFMPRFGLVNERRNQLHEVIRLSGVNLIINETDHPLIIKVASVQSVRMQVYFIDNDDYFTHRRHTFADGRGREYEDNSERAFFYIRGVIETIRKLRWQPDIIYCQGWFAAVAPIYIRKHYGDDPCFRGSKIVTALYDDAFTKHFPPTFSKMIKCEGITRLDLSEVRDKPVSHNMLCRLAIKFSDAVIQTDKQVNPELITYAQSRGCQILDASDEYPVISKYDSFFEELAGKPEEEEE